MVLVVLVSEKHLNSGGFEKAQLIDGFFFSLQGPDGPRGKLGLPGDMVTKFLLTVIFCISTNPGCIWSFSLPAFSERAFQINGHCWYCRSSVFNVACIWWSSGLVPLWWKHYSSCNVLSWFTVFCRFLNEQIIHFITLL